MTGADWPGMSRIQRLFSPPGVQVSGRFFSSLAPAWAGPRQLSQPATASAAWSEGGKQAANRIAGSRTEAERLKPVVFIAGHSSIRRKNGRIIRVRTVSTEIFTAGLRSRVLALP